MNLRQPPPGTPVPAGDPDDGTARAISVTDARPSRLAGQTPPEYWPAAGREAPPRDPAWRAAPRRDAGRAAPPWDAAGRPEPPWEAAGRAAPPGDRFPVTVRRAAAESAVADGRQQPKVTRHAAGGRHAGAAPVFADLSGRRLRRMRLAGLAAAGVLLACLVVTTVGLLGGPRAPFLPWGTRGAASSPAGSRTAGPAAASAAPSVPAPRVPPSPPASASASPSVRATAVPAPAASAAASPAPLVTNAVGKAPPGRNR